MLFTVCIDTETSVSVPNRDSRRSHYTRTSLYRVDAIGTIYCNLTGISDEWSVIGKRFRLKTLPKN